LNQNSPTNSKLKSRSAQSFGKILGHGLGLGIVKAILRLHQFELAANSNAQGTQIKIYCK
jgi:signal transduction histidine kinase